MLLVPLVSLLLSSRLDQLMFSFYDISILPRRQAGRMRVISARSYLDIHVHVYPQNLIKIDVQ